jgi:ribose 5-phosphate isomerase B
MIEMDKVRVYIGADHAGFEMKAQLHEYLESEGYNVIDLGCFTPEACDYPDIAREVGEKAAENHGAMGILLCGSGIGMEMAANKVKGVRATVLTDENMADTARRHNNANVATIGSRNTDLESAKKILMKFLTTEFEAGEERHVRRVQKIDAITDLNK